MQVVKVAFLKGDKSIAGRLIKWWTKGPYSHVAIVIDGIEYSASFSDRGVYSKPHIEDKDKWDYIDVEVKSLNILNLYNITKYDSYDLLGILGFIVPFKDRSTEWFCSEWVANALKISGYRFLWTKEPSKISPNKLFEILV